MASQKEIDRHAKAIIDAHDGQIIFNLTAAKKILSCGENTVARLLHDAGVTVQRRGKEKLVTAFGLAECALFHHIAPIDNISRWPARPAQITKKAKGGEKSA